MKISTLIFDVNETLLDMDPLKERINKALKKKNASDIWFEELLHYSLVESITNTYHDFSEIAAAVFKMNAQKSGIHFSDKEITEILSPIRKLNAYPEVAPGLIKLKNAGYQLIAFSNGKPSVLREQLDHAGLSDNFDKILSVESTKKYKPHSDTYKYAIKEAGAEIENTMMVAAHGWDILGASRSGLKTAFIQRSGKFLYPLSQSPTMEMADIEALANNLYDLKIKNENR